MILTKEWKKVSPEKIEGVLEPQWHNEVLRIGVEFAGDMGRWQRGAAGAGTGDWMIQGWTWALQVDNCRYDFSLLLKKVETGYIAPGSSTEAIPEDRGEVWRIPVRGSSARISTKICTELSIPSCRACA